MELIGSPLINLHTNSRTYVFPFFRRWLIIGRGKFVGGSNFHQDPMGDSWNTLLDGRKKWIVIEPSTHDYSIG